ncbi:MAG: Uma2 family endonuclease [Acidobacteria bacterium]|nr:Uma2 family endonuclease [Acidobacteriota bacterium]
MTFSTLGGRDTIRIMNLALPEMAQDPPLVVPGPVLSGEELLALCSEHEDLEFETNCHGELEVIPNTGVGSSVRNGSLTAQLVVWAEATGLGAACDSGALFLLPNGARRSPDSAWISP